jgi:hypothetical protein
MSDSDSILAGFTAAVFAFIGINVVVCCLRKKRQSTPKMKASPSMENLNQDDPVVV